MKEDKKARSQWVSGFVTAVLWGLGLILAILLASALALSKGLFSPGALVRAGSVAVAAGALFSGFVLARRTGDKPLVSGGVSGLFMFAALYAVGLLSFFRIVPQKGFFETLLICLLAGIAGAFLGGHKKKKRRIR